MINAQTGLIYSKYTYATYIACNTGEIKGTRPVRENKTTMLKTEHLSYKAKQWIKKIR